MSEKSSLREGFSLVEGILAAGLLGMLVTSLVGLFIYGQESTRIAGTRMIAVFLAEEGMEAVRNIRDEALGFANLTTSTHGLKLKNTACSADASTYALCDSSDTIGIYTRTITICDTLLDSGCDSVASPTRKKVISTVTWAISPARTGTVSIENHFTDWNL